MLALLQNCSMPRALGSWMKFCPDRVLGGSSPVQACLRHSMMVCAEGNHCGHGHAAYAFTHTKIIVFRRDSSYSFDQAEGSNRLLAHRLASAILPDDERERAVELDDMLVVWAEAANALHQQLVNAAHACCRPTDLRYKSV